MPKTRKALSGKLIFLIITVTVATGSFTLGYFVGKNFSSTHTVQSAVQPVVQKPSGVESPGETGETKPSEMRSPALPSLEQNVKTGKNSLASGSVVPVQEPKQIFTEPKMVSDTKSATAQHNGKESTQETTRDHETQGAEMVYAVQVGAFKSRSEADTLKAELEEKGYNARSLKVSSKGAAFFKVTVGEFAQKKEAEVVALKLKKAEGLKAFVTRKN